MDRPQKPVNPKRDGVGYRRVNQLAQDVVTTGTASIAKRCGSFLTTYMDSSDLQAFSLR